MEFHGIFKKRWPMKIFFHGRVHDDSRNPSGTSNNFVVK